MNMSVNSSMNFKGGVITANDDDFEPAILHDALPKNTNSNNIAIHLDPKDGIRFCPKNSKLILWGDDSDLFTRFFKKHYDQIPALPEDQGLSSLSEGNVYQIRAGKLAQALTEVTEISQALTKETVASFISVSENLTKNILTQKTLQDALRKISK